MNLKIDREEIERRHDAIRASMTAEGLDLLVIHSSPLYSMYIHYASNYDLMGEGATVILPISGDPILYVSESWDRDRAAKVSPIADVRASSNLASVCGDYLRAPRSAMAGIEWVDRDFTVALIASAGRDVPSGTKALERAAHRKTAIERELIRQAAALADDGFERGFNALVPGMREFELAAEIEFGMRNGGAVDNFGLLSAGHHNRAIGLPTDKPVEIGDMLIFEITPARLNRNYSAQLCRTMCVGPATTRAHERYAIIEEALEAGLAKVRPGTPISEVTIAQDDVISRHGFGEYCRPPYMRARGHGFGVGRIDLSRKNPQLLEEGMAMIVHPNQYFPDVGYLALGEMVIVTDSGPERLCRLRPGIFETRI